MATRRWWHAGSRHKAPRPLWLATLASVAFVVVTGTAIGIDDPGSMPTVLIVLAAMAAVTLLAAYHMAAPLVLLGYGAIACVMIGLGVERWVADGFQLPVYLLAATLFSVPAIPEVGQRLRELASPLAVFAQPRPRHELFPLGITAGIAFVFLILESVLSIVGTYSNEVQRELSTPAWAVHLAVLAIAIGGSVWLGRRSSDVARSGPIGTVLPWIPVTFGALIVASITSMVTSNIVYGSWIAIVTAVLLIGVPVLWRPGERFLLAVRSTISTAGPILLAGAVILNLSVDTGEHLGGQFIVYGALASLTGAIAARRRSANLIYVAALLVTLACWFGTRYGDAGDMATLLTFVVLAWGIAGIAAMVHGRGVNWAAAPLMVAGTAISIASVAFVAPELDDIADIGGDRLRELTIVWLLSLAGLLALSGWMFRRRDLPYWASGLAMAALLLQIGSRPPDNVHAYTLPITVWLFALGWIERKNRSAANPLFGFGAAFLVLPGLWMANRTGEFGWLFVCLGEGVGLFLFGLMLRLRIPLAAGVITLSILVLRMVIDVVNALPNWGALLSVGLALLIGGTVWISFRDDVRRWWDAIRAQLGPLR